MTTHYIHAALFTGTEQAADAFSVQDGRFTYVGTSEEVLASAGPEDTVTDCAGRFICAGFNDSHMHLLNYGLAMEQCDLMPHTDSLESLIAALQAFLAQNPRAQGGWLRGRGWNQDYFTDCARMPDRHDLDRVSTEIPVCITRCCGHCLSINTAALTQLGITAATPQPEGGHFDIGSDGTPTGVFRDTAMALVSDSMPAPTEADIQHMLKKAAAAVNRYGVTSVQTDDFCVFPGVPWQTIISAYQALEREGSLTVRAYEQSHFSDPAALQKFLDAGYTTGIGSAFYRIGPLKMLGDGSLGARTAYLKAPYSDAPDTHGLAIFTKQQFTDMFTVARKGNMQIAVHAIGNGILEDILDAYDAVFAVLPANDHRCGIVHVQITDEKQLQRMAALGLHAYAQTVFLDYDSHIVTDRVGAERASTSYAFHTLKNLGVHVSNGTDCPVEYPDALRGIQCAVTRQCIAQDAPVYRPEEAMTVEEALLTYTKEGAHASFEESVKGIIAPGMYADFVMLAEDPRRTAPEKIHAIPVLATYLNGACVYRAE